ncbi:MAG: hypothetical protein R3Y45_04515 [Bacillota bacterium]
MKNKIFRVAVVATLTIAMMLTFVSCSSNSGGVSTPTVTVNPDATAAPVITQTPVEKTPSPTSTPKVEVSDDFGLKVESVDGTYGTNLEDAYGEEQSPAYFEITWEESLTEAHYELVLEVEIESDSEDYYINIRIPSANADLTYPRYYNGSSYSELTYVSDGDYYEQKYDDIYFTITENTLTIWIDDAGEYELVCEAFVTDMADNFGAWDNEDDPDEFEFYFTSELEIEKEQITIEIDPAVIAEVESSLYVLVEGKNGGSETYSKYTTSYDKATDATTVYLPSTYIFGDYEIELSYSMAYVEEGKVGTYSVEIEEEYKYDDKTYDDLDDLNELFDNYEIVGVKDTAIYVISGYDYAEIADVITSIAEINFTSTDGFFEGSSNIEVQLPLAEKRYAALSTAQKAYFDTFAKITFSNYTTAMKSNVGAFINGGFAEDATSNDEAIALKEYMEFAREELDDYLILEAFEEFAEDSDLPAYNETFNVLNSKHIAYFNSVDEYFNALDDESQELIETNRSNWYTAYANAKSDILNAEIDSVEQLIVGAYQAYLKSISNGTKIVYQDMNTKTADDETTVVSSWAYIESAEVVSLTNQALTAYNTLSDEGKDLLEGLGVDSMIYGLTYNRVEVVKFETGTNTAYNALEKLVDMNEMIETMIIISQYVNIDDYSTNAVAYERLTRLVYGVADSETGVTGGMYFPTYSGATDATDYRYAMQDIINAPERNYDAIIAEYKEWLLYIEAIETYKTTVMIEFVFQLDSAVSALDKDDYEESVISKANSSSFVYGLVLAAVNAEEIYIDLSEYGMPGVLTIVSGALDPTNFDSVDILGGTSGVDITPFVDAEGNFLDGKDNFDEIYEAYDEFLDMDDLLDSYIDAIKEKS